MKLRDKPYSSLYNPKSAQIRGMRSALAPSALGDGEFVLIQNWRWDRRSLRVRDGTAALSGPIATDGSSNPGAYRGHWTGLLNGTQYIIVAYLVLGKVRLYKTSPGGVSGLEITTAPLDVGTNRVKYPDSRFPTDAFCSFCSVRDQEWNPRDVLIISNGVDAPRVYDPLENQLHGATVAIHDEIPLPTNALNFSHRSIAKFPTHMPVAGASLPTYTALNSGRFGAADNGSPPNNNCRLTIDNSVLVNDWVKLDKAAMSLERGRQLIFLVDDHGVTDIWERLKVEISEDNSTFHTLWDGGTQTYDYVQVPASWQDNKYLIAFSHDHLTLGQKNATRYIRFTFLGPAPTAPIDIDIYGIFGGGFVPGGADYGWAYKNKGARSESPGIIVASGPGKRIKDMGGTALDNAEIPVSPLLMYAYDVPYIRATLAQMEGGLDALSLYRRDEGSEDYYLVDVDTQATWSFATLWIANDPGKLLYLTNGISAEDLDFAQAIPDAYHKTIPRGKYLHAANDRLFVGNMPSAVSDVWFSQDRQPFRFRQSLRTDATGAFDPQSPCSFECGTEIVQGFASVPADSVGLNSVFIFTDGALCQVEGLDSFSLSKMRRKAAMGTLSPRSITTYRDSVFWVDSDMQVRILSGGTIAELSRYAVDDKLQAVVAARRDDIIVTFFKDRLYVAYSTPLATTNDRMLVWNAIERTWEADDKFKSPCSAEGLSTWLDQTTKRPRLLAFGTDAKMYEYEQPDATQDLGFSIETRLVTGDLGIDLFQDFHIHCLGFMIDDVASGTISVVVTYKPYGQTQTFDVLNVDVSSDQAHLWLNQVPTWADESKDTGGVTSQIDIQGSLLGGKVLHSIALEAESRGSRAKRLT